MANTKLIQSLRNRTNLPYSAIQKAIKSLDTDDEDKLIEHMRKEGVLKSQARQDRETNHGRIEAYSHDGRIGVLAVIKCETDFVAKSESFIQLCKDIALHIAANQPKFLSSEDISQEFIDQELAIAREQLKNEGKPEEILDKILEGKKAKISQESSLLSQPFLKNTEITVQDIVNQTSQSTGEKIVIEKFTVFSLNS